MRARLRVAVLVVVAVALSATLIFFSGDARGAVMAVVDHVRGRPCFYQLGCVAGPAKDPVEFRFEELLAQRYGVRRVTVGGIVPSPFVADFVDSYDAVSYKILKWRFGADFAKSARDEATRDVRIHHAVIRGCYDSAAHDLVLYDHAKPAIHVRYAGPFSSASSRVPVVVSGTLTEVVAGDWNRWWGPMLDADHVSFDAAGDCGQLK